MNTYKMCQITTDKERKRKIELRRYQNIDLGICL